MIGEKRQGLAQSKTLVRVNKHKVFLEVLDCGGSAAFKSVETNDA
jgi:hypothetical protein